MTSPNNIPLSTNEKLRNYQENFQKKINLIKTEKETIEQICNDLIRPIINYQNSSIVELQKCEDFYFNCLNTILTETGRNNSGENLNELFNSNFFLKRESEVRNKIINKKRLGDLLLNLKKSVYYSLFCESSDNFHNLPAEKSPSQMVERPKINTIIFNNKSSDNNVTKSTVTHFSTTSNTLPNLNTEERDENKSEQISYSSYTSDSSFQGYNNSYSSEKSYFTDSFERNYQENPQLNLRVYKPIISVFLVKKSGTQKVACYSRKLKLNYNVQILMTRDDILDKHKKIILEQMMIRYFEDYFYVVTNRECEFCGTTKNLKNLINFLKNNGVKLDYREVTINIYKSFSQIMKFYTRDCETNMQPSQLAYLKPKLNKNILGSINDVHVKLEGDCNLNFTSSSN